MRIVDTRGQLCPAPIILTKRVLKETVEGESFIVMTDSPVSLNNLQRFLKDNETRFTAEEKAGVWRLTVTKTAGFSSDIRAENYCAPAVAHFEKGDFVVVISSDRMGEGDEELGRLLMGNFIKALKDLEKLPRKIMFYNSGVNLVTRNSPEIEHLRQLVQMGVEILACSTCVNYYKLENEIGAGTISDMYTIAEAMASAGKIIKP